MSKIPPALCLLALVTFGSTHAQAPTGTIAGVVTDPKVDGSSKALHTSL